MKVNKKTITALLIYLPTALNRGKIIKDLKMLVDLGIPIKVKEYNFNSPPYLNKYIEIKPSRLIIVEGLFLFHYKELLKMLDMTVYVVVDSEIQLKRRLKSINNIVVIRKMK